MRIAIIGNMNNAYFSLCRYLRDAGFDCHLLIFKNEPLHFDPSCDTRTSEYKNYCTQLAWGDPADFLGQDFDTVKKDLAPFQFLIGNGPAPAYAEKAGRKLDVFMPYGYDLYSLPFIRLVHPFRMPSYLLTAYAQRKGIRQADYILFDRTNRKFEKVFDRLRFNGERVVCANPMIYYKEYLNGFDHKEAAQANQIDVLRRENELLFVQHARQVWKHDLDGWSGKGNDMLIRGYALFLKKYPSVRSKLVLFEYGTDVKETKKLVKTLGMEASVLWMPKMPRKDLIHVLEQSDLIIGELFHSWLTYGVALEALSLGKPLMHFRKDEEFSADYPELYPMLNAWSDETVFQGLERMLQHREDMERMGRQGREWFLTYCVDRSVKKIASLIREKQLEVHD